MSGQLVKEYNEQARGKRSLRLWLKLLRSATLIERDLQARLRGTEITLPRFDFLAVLYRAETELGMGDLSSRLMVSNGNVSGLADRLTKQGLIRRWQWPDDRRHWYVALTQKGRTLFEQLALEHEQWVAAAMEGLDDEEIEALTGLLTKLSHTVELPHAPSAANAEA